MLRTIFLALLLCFPEFAYADITKIFDKPCQEYGIPKKLIVAIAKTESSLHTWAINIGGKDFMPKTMEQALHLIKQAEQQGLSYDVGIMQINSWWLKRLKIRPEIAILPHNNAKLGVWILANEIARHGFNLKAIGAYHTPVDRNPARARSYVQRVLKNLKRG